MGVVFIFVITIQKIVLFERNNDNVGWMKFMAIDSFNYSYFDAVGIIKYTLHIGEKLWDAPYDLIKTPSTNMD